MAEAALADEWVKTGDRLSLQRRVLRLGKPPRRWRKPPWAAAASWEPPVLTLIGKPLASVIGKTRCVPYVRVNYNTSCSPFLPPESHVISTQTLQHLYTQSTHQHHMVHC